MLDPERVFVYRLTHVKFRVCGSAARTLPRGVPGVAVTPPSYVAGQ